MLALLYYIYSPTPNALLVRASSHLRCVHSLERTVFYLYSYLSPMFVSSRTTVRYRLSSENDRLALLPACSSIASMIMLQAFLFVYIQIIARVLLLYFISARS